MRACIEDEIISVTVIHESIRTRLQNIRKTSLTTVPTYNCRDYVGEIFIEAIKVAIYYISKL